jgi:hypothetical protein
MDMKRITIDRFALAAMLATMGSIAVFSSCIAAAEKPAATVTMPDGVERRFFTSGPLGTTTYRIDVARDGREAPRVQVLKDDIFQQIPNGATDAEVYALVGPPARKEIFSRTQTIAWDYHYRDGWGYESDFAVVFDAAGRVVGRFSTRDSG